MKVSRAQLDQITTNIIVEQRGKEMNEIAQYEINLNSRRLIWKYYHL